MPANKLLFIAYHYPPITVSSGYQRTLAFSRNLGQHDWSTAILTADYKAYERYDLTQLKSIPADVRVLRAFAKDTQRDLSVKGRYLRSMALPDKWQSWILGGVFTGLAEIRRNRPDVIISTYPIASAHAIGYWLNRLTGIPWVADFRDPMVQEGYPEDPRVNQSFKKIERRVFSKADRILCVTQGAIDFYASVYPHARNKLSLVPNGYDEQAFSASRGVALPEGLVKEKLATTTSTPRPHIMLHSGVVYPSERDPTALFDALKSLKSKGLIRPESFRLVLRATAHDELLASFCESRGISALVDFLPPVPYLQALKEMQHADSLLLLQAANCNEQIPAKAYEYIRAGRPVLTLTDPAGETGKLMAQQDKARVASLDKAGEIETALEQLLAKGSSTDVAAIEEDHLAMQFSRVHTAAMLAKVLDEVVAP